MYHTQQIKLKHLTEQQKIYLTYLCQTSNSLYDSVLFKIRDIFFQEHQEFSAKITNTDVPRCYRKLKKIKTFSYAELCKEFKNDRNFKILPSAVAQQTIKSVVEAIQSYNALVSCFFKGEIKNAPKFPNYRTKRGLYQLATPARWVEWDLETGECSLTISNSVRKDTFEELGFKRLVISGGSGFSIDDVAEVRIIPKLGDFYAEYVYNVENFIASDLDYNQALGIDHGRDNWLTCVSTRGKSFIVDGHKLKSININYNRKIAKLKKGKSEYFWNSELDSMTTKRNHKMRDAINKTARFLINHCLFYRIGVIVFGWNPEQKQSSPMSRVQNQQFVQIPTGRLKTRIQQLCEEYGIKFIETEEAYTSKASFLDGDSLPRHGEKPSQWTASGKRVKRGMYKSADYSLINADCNGAANILKKVSTQLGLHLAEVSKVVLNLPQRYNIFSCLKRPYRKRSEARLQPA